MSPVPSPIPANFVAGVSLDQPFQPLFECGADNPFFYHSWGDDFNPYRATDYTVLATGTGAAVAAITGDGGLVQFTTGSTAGVVGLQSGTATSAAFTVNSPPKKVFFEMRLKMSAWATAGITGTFGLIEFTATPGTVTDGIWFGLSATGVLTINSTVGSVNTAVALPVGSYNLVANAFTDFAFYLNRSGDVLAFVDSQLVGYVTQNLIGTPGNPQNAGAIARITAPTLTAVNLTPTIAFTQAGATVVTAVADFVQVQKER